MKAFMSYYNKEKLGIRYRLVSSNVSNINVIYTTLLNFILN